MKKKIVSIPNKISVPIKFNLSKETQDRFKAAFYTTRYDLSTIVITYPFYAKIKMARNKQFYPVLYGNNHEIVFTGETHKNKNDVVQLLKMWFPQLQIKR